GVSANLGKRLERFDASTTTNPLFTVYETSDGWLAIAALQAPQWPGIARAVGLEHMLDDPRFADFTAVGVHRDEFRPIFAERMASNTTQHWWSKLRYSGAWVSPVNRLEDLAGDDNIIANEYLVTFDDGFIGQPVPFEVDGYKGARGLAADYGQHTDEVLAELGYDDDEVLQLKIDGAVW
ncbi:MAG: CoA transferase, partial [Actinomycetota bacterium]|nr:CoA transferase [Actinomycetota bacterium]